MTKKKDIILVNICIVRFLKYGIESIRRFWDKIKDKFETTIDRKYAEVCRYINNFIIKRKANIKVSHKLEYAARDNNYTQTIDK